MRLLIALFLTLFATAAQAKDLPVVPAQAECEKLSAVSLDAIGGPGSKVVAARETTSGGISVCAVDLVLAPQINVSVLLPKDSWTQRYMQVGCGGLCGSVTLQSGASSGCAVLNAGGFVMAATDMGHSGGMADSGEWGANDQQRADFAYRAQHLTAAAAKALIAAYYGQGPAYSYFNGCSDGGREALMEAERFPDDFDGIIAGAPAMLFQVQNTLYHGWMARTNSDAEGKAILLSAKLPLIHSAVLAACDAQDGAEDGLVSEPALCQFEPSSLLCADGADPGGCLTAAEVNVIAMFYDGPRDATTGAALTAGQPQYGSELNWQGVYVPDQAGQPTMSSMVVPPVLRYLAFDPARPDMTLTDLQFTEGTLAELRPRHPLFDATMADLGAFQTKGGKLILWHGLADPHISPANTLAFHKAMVATMGQDKVDGFERLYLFPGMGHCGGGQGPSAIDLLTPMLAWVEDGIAPGAVVATSSEERSSFGQPDGGDQHGGPPPQADLGVAPLPAMTRPVYPWPHVAAYAGQGEMTAADNWTEGPAAEVVLIRDWPGADLFGPYRFIDD